MIIKKHLKNVIEVQNFFKEKDLLKILKKFQTSRSWKKINQVRDKHYSHVFKNNSPYLPAANEKYLSQFSRNEKLSKDKYINLTVINKKIQIKKFQFQYLK